MNRRLLAIAVGLVAALVFAGGAASALEVRLSVKPARPQVGQTVSIVVRPFWPYLREDGTCCRLEQADVDYPFRLEAVSPRGRVFTLRVRRSPDPFTWTARFSFRSSGRWIVRATNWGPRYDTSAGGRPRISVLVRP